MTAVPDGEPWVTTPVRIESDWCDANAWLRAAFYTAAFDLGIDHLKQVIGIDAAYRQSRMRSTVALEARVKFLRRVNCADVVSIASRIIDCDSKRIHLAQAMQVAENTIAVRENLTISFDLQARRSCPFEPAILARIERLHLAQRALPPYATAQALRIEKELST